LKARAIQWLAQREHSRTELQRKLLPFALAEGVSTGARAVGASAAGDAVARDVDAESAKAAALTRVEVLLDWLEASRYLSTQRFAESRVHARAARFGNLRIRQELAQHQVVLSVEAEQALKDTELERARAVWSARFQRGPGGAAERAKQARFLAGRGFAAEVVYRLLRDVERGDVEDSATAQPAAD
jgi:regulatory protein